MDLPKMMNGIGMSGPGGPDVLKIERQQLPELNEGEVLIKTAFAGVNRPDCLQRMGAYPPPPGASAVLGLEVSGEIVACHEALDQKLIGKRVMALTAGGGYAEYVKVDYSNTLSIPDGISLEEAAGMPETFFTVWHNVFQRGNLKNGEVFLVHGGTSGIGTTTIQMAKAFGATVIATAGSGEKCDACLALGADHTINYHQLDFVKSVKDLTDGTGADLILDMVGGQYIERNYDAAAMDGRIVQIAFLGGAKAEVNFAKLMMKRLTHTGSTLRARSVAFKAQIAKELQSDVWPLVEQNKIRPVMDKRFRLEDAASAHELMESSTHIGKITLEVNHA